MAPFGSNQKPSRALKRNRQQPTLHGNRLSKNKTRETKFAGPFQRFSQPIYLRLLPVVVALTVVAVAWRWLVWLLNLLAFLGGPVVVLLAERRHRREGRDRECCRHHYHRKNLSKLLHHYLPPPFLRLHAGEAG